jgi:hypothetical protein
MKHNQVHRFFILFGLNFQGVEGSHLGPTSSRLSSLLNTNPKNEKMN